MLKDDVNKILDTLIVICKIIVRTLLRFYTNKQILYKILITLLNEKDFIAQQDIYREGQRIVIKKEYQKYDFPYCILHIAYLIYFFKDEYNTTNINFDRS